jgi:NAD(P)-dependent dehydrogenase (short-subunit alcohol dehydrogenase family)
MKYILITGGSGGIGLAFTRYFLSLPDTLVFSTFRSDDYQLKELKQAFPDRFSFCKMDITKEEEIIEVIDQVKQKTDRLHYVINCVGFLQTDNIQPEKNLRSLNADNLIRYFQVNSIGAVLLAKHLISLFKHEERSVFATLSAKVGSIGDNKLGGWYGYRASKAALNMFIRSVSIEYQRITPKTIVVLLHPGTTDTNLSLPFQANVPLEKLFSPDRAVLQLMEIIDQLTIDRTGTFWSWDKSELPW